MHGLPPSQSPVDSVTRVAARIGGLRNSNVVARNAAVRHALVAALSVAVLLAGRGAYAVTIDETHWGFDGQVVRHRFNLLSVLVNNPTAQTVDGELRLRKFAGPGMPVDTVIVEPLYLAPYSSRWIQFHPYVKQEWEDWELSWGTQSAERTTLARPRFGKSAAVILDDPGVVASAGGAMKRFPDNLFPPSVTATECLRAVVFDHVPRWEEPRRQAFLAWLRGGGRAVVIYGPNGQYPEFPAALAELNVPVDSHRVGSGVVVREPRSRREIDAPWVKRYVLAETEKKPKHDDDGKSASPSDPVTQYDRQNNPFLRIEWEGDAVFFTALKLMSRPEHLWPLIHLLSLVYLGMLFPGCYLFGRSRPDYRVVFAALAGTAAFFSALFAFIGRRGYDEASVVHAAAIARPVGEGVYDVQQWTNAFSIDGEEYTFLHDGTGRMYSTAQNDEAVRGTIRTGNEARLIADVPPCSARSFAHRAVVSAPPLELRIDSFTVGADDPNRRLTARNDIRTSAGRFIGTTMLRELDIACGPTFPENPERVYALHGSHFYQMNVETAPQRRLRLRGSVGSLKDLMNLEEYTGFEFDWGPWDKKERTPEALFQRLFSPLVVRSLGIVDQDDLDSYRVPEDRIRLFIYAPMPPEFLLKTDAFSVQRGFVLYSVDVFLPE